VTTTIEGLAEERWEQFRDSVKGRVAYLPTDKCFSIKRTGKLYPEKCSDLFSKAYEIIDLDTEDTKYTHLMNLMEDKMVTILKNQSKGEDNEMLKKAEIEEKAKAKEVRAQEKQKKEKEKEEKAAAKIVVSSQSKDAKERIEGYLAKKVRVQSKDKTPMVYFLGAENTIHFWAASPDLSQQTVFNKFISALRGEEEASQKEHSEWIEGVYGLLKVAEGVAATAKTKPPTFKGLVCEIMNDNILLNRTDICNISGDAPSFTWDEEKQATHRLPAHKLVEGPTPHFDSFLKRVDFPKELMAFVWKIFKEEDCKGRQMAWGYSAGNAGQSTFWGAIQSIIEPITASMTNQSYNNQFSEAKFFRKRLAIMADCKSRNFHTTNLCKKLTGSDLADIENKNQDSFRGTIWCRVVVHSNLYPDVDTSDESLNTRLLLFRLTSLEKSTEDLQMDEKYKEEIWHFLWKCREVERELCSGKLAQIPVPDGMKESIQIHCEDPVRLHTRGFMENVVYKKEGSFVEEVVLWSKLEKYLQVKCGIGNSYVNSLRAKETRSALLTVVKNIFIQKLGIEKGVEGFEGRYIGVALREFDIEDSKITIHTEEQPSLFSGQQQELDTSDMDL
jgi:ribosomal protein S17E